MNCLEAIGKEIRALALMMLDDAEDALKEMGISHYAFDRKACRICVFSGNGSERHLQFLIHAVPYSRLLVVYYMHAKVPAQIIPDTAEQMPLTERVPVYRFRWKKHCRHDLSLAIRKLQSEAVVEN